MRRLLALLLLVLPAACAGASRQSPDAPPRGRDVRPGVTVFVRDSLALIRGLRVGLITNQTGIDERGRTTIDLLHEAAPQVRGRLVALFSPEHGIRGTEDRQFVESGRDGRTGLPVHTLYTSATIPPPDSLLLGIDVLVIDLFDIGTRTWTYVGAMLYAVRAAGRLGMRVIVLDRPNPLGGRAEGPLLDSALANPADPAPGRPGRAYALYPAPLRHGLTMGEMARWFNAELGLGAELHVIPVEGWRRSMWWDETPIPWVRPSPNIPTLTSALLYPALVAFEGSNVSVGRGTAQAFQQIGAPWLDAPRVAELLEERGYPGVSFEAVTFTPEQPGDNKYPGRRIPGVRITVTDRDRVPVSRVGAALVWALGEAHPDSLRVTNASFDLRWGDSGDRERLLAGRDPDEVIDRWLGDVVAWQQRVRPYLLYR
jgi:uncharacterized protein YbbC (DUF1343 family)